MKYTLLLLTLITCTLFSGCVEADFSLTRDSPLPKGLQSDKEAMRAAAEASTIELWTYTIYPARLKFYKGFQLFLTRDEDPGSSRRATPNEHGVDFFCRFNGIESGFQIIDPGWMIKVVEPAITHPPPLPIRGANNF